MGNKIVKALQPLDMATRSVKKGDQIELDEKEADDLIKRGLAEEGHIEGDAERRRPEDMSGNDPYRPTDQVRPLSGASFPTQPDNKMQPDGRSNK